MLYLTCDLRAIDGKLLFKSGQAITRRALDALARSSPPHRCVRLSATAIYADISCAFRDRRYATIFSPEQVHQEILKQARNVILPEPIIREILRFKSRMPYTYRHILRTAALSALICLDKSWPKTCDPAGIIRMSLVHDLGKSRIPVEVLDKETALTAEENSILKTHPLIGYILLHYYGGRDHHLYDHASFEHHERLDGSGYPRHIRRLRLHSQIIAVVDVFDALISSRPYRKEPYTMRAALDHLLDEAKAKKLRRPIVIQLIAHARSTKPSPKKLRLSKRKRDAPPRDNFYGKILPAAENSLKPARGIEPPTC